jgi:hypothetical protein
VVVDVRRTVVVLALLVLAALLVRVDDQGVIVVVLVVMGAVLELPERATRVVVGDVIVIVAVDDGRMRMLVFDVARDTLHLLGHRVAPLGLGRLGVEARTARVTVGPDMPPSRLQPRCGDVTARVRR